MARRSNSNVTMKKLKFEINWWINQKIAIALFYLGRPPGCTTFIDEVTMSYGYGKLDNLGLWQYQLPFGFIENRRKK